MPTDNRRVATYLPPELDTHFKAFIAERNLKGDSLALITILSEYFEVAHPASQKVDYSGFVKIEQFQELAAKVDELSEQVNKGSFDSGLLRKLPERVKRLEEELKRVGAFKATLPYVEDEPAPVLPDTVPGQMDLLGLKSELLVDEGGSQTHSLNEVDSGLKSSLDGELKPMVGYSLSKRFGLHQQVVGNNKNNWKDDPEKFTRWAQSKDPDGIPWRYNSEDKLYYPIVDGSLVDLSELPVELS